MLVSAGSANAIHSMVNAVTRLFDASERTGAAIGNPNEN
jgi:hypothetical protein